MLKLVLWMLALILGLALVVVVIGFMLPKQHVAARAISVGRKPHDVFELISDFKAAPSWRPDVQEVQLLPSTDGHIRYRERGRNGIITMEVVESRRHAMRLCSMAVQPTTFISKGNRGIAFLIRRCDPPIRHNLPHNFANPAKTFSFRTAKLESLENMVNPPIKTRQELLFL